MRPPTLLVSARGAVRAALVASPVLAALAALRPGGLLAQQLAPVEAAPATSYLDRYREIVALKPVPGQVAQVERLVLTRGAARLTFERGQLYLLSPVGGRTVAAVFRGDGRLAYAPPHPVEREELRRQVGAPALDAAIAEAILIFADTTMRELAGVTFVPGEIPGAVRDHATDFVGSLRGDNEGAFSDDIMSPLLNGESNGFFLARVERPGESDLLFTFDPDVNEASQLRRPVGRIRWGTRWALVTRSPPDRRAVTWWYRRRLDVPHYGLDIRLTPRTTGELEFAARGTLTLVAVEPVGPWLRFGLHGKLTVDSARWNDGRAAPVFKADDDGTLWVRAERRLEPGDTLALTVYYGGDLIDRYGDWFFLPPSADWYPVNGQGGNLATFDLTFHSPSWYPLGSIGERVDSARADRWLTTRWVARRPTPYASFNLGLFESGRIEQAGAPSLDVLISETAHRELRKAALQRGFTFPEQRNMREAVVADVVNSLKLFESLFGAPPLSHYIVTEIPYLEGVSFPGLIHLSWSTFQQTALDGFDHFFRAHEVAHQWWGNAVRPATYRDAWLSEGLATFSALWYLQNLRKRNEEYFRFLGQYKANMGDYRGSIGPIWVGYRNATPDTPLGYQVTVYEKGAWVFHMLRTLMLDLQTRKDDRFIGMMQDFYQTFGGGTASTEEFQAIVERHAGVPMDWFFDAWVTGTAIPTYRVAWTTEPAADGKYRVRLRVIQEGVPVEFQQFVLVSVDLGNERFAHFRVGVHGNQTEYFSPLLPVEPKGLTFNELHSVLADVKRERW